MGGERGPLRRWSSVPSSVGTMSPGDASRNLHAYDLEEWHKWGVRQRMRPIDRLVQLLTWI